jgi:hypothetical protein
MADCLIGCAADQTVFIGEALDRQRIEYALGLSHDFGADAVSREQGDQHGLASSQYVRGCPMVERKGQAVGPGLCRTILF